MEQYKCRCGRCNQYIHYNEKSELFFVCIGCGKLLTHKEITDKITTTINLEALFQ